MSSIRVHGENPFSAEAMRFLEEEEAKERAVSDVRSPSGAPDGSHDPQDIQLTGNWLSGVFKGVRSGGKNKSKFVGYAMELAEGMQSMMQARAFIVACSGAAIGSALFEQGKQLVNKSLRDFSAWLEIQSKGFLNRFMDMANFDKASQVDGVLVFAHFLEGVINANGPSTKGITTDDGTFVSAEWMRQAAASFAQMRFGLATDDANNQVAPEKAGTFAARVFALLNLIVPTIVDQNIALLVRAKERPSATSQVPALLVSLNTHIQALAKGLASQFLRGNKAPSTDVDRFDKMLKKMKIEPMNLTVDAGRLVPDGQKNMDYGQPHGDGTFVSAQDLSDALRNVEADAAQKGEFDAYAQRESVMQAADGFINAQPGQQVALTAARAERMGHRPGMYGQTSAEDVLERAGDAAARYLAERGVHLPSSGRMGGGMRHGGHMDGGMRHGGHMDGGMRHGDHMDGGMRHGDHMDGGMRHGGHMDGGMRHGGHMDGGMRHGGHMDGGMRHGNKVAEDKKPSPANAPRYVLRNRRRRI